MKKVFVILIQTLCLTAGFSQSPPWKANGEAISARPDLIVHWQDSTKFPRKVWSYQLLPNNFSAETISNVMALCSFNEKAIAVHHADGIDFQSPDDARKLSISFSSGNIHYETPEPRYSPTNLAANVPTVNELPPIATNVLRKLHIGFSDITGWASTNGIDYSEPVLTMYYVGDLTITNIAYRSVLFRRVVDGMPIVGEFYGFNVGEHGRITRLSIAWPNLQRSKSHSVISQKEVINLLRKGDAIRGPAPQDVGDIDWSSIKSLTIKKAVPSYQMDGDRLYPFLRLDVLVDTGSVTVEIGMDCPLIDEAE
ncbi:MAG TPA: hypothetical protein VIK59_00320 [Verrucomicrobiae bacterium]